jgi:molybdopterin guanine dinucleotide-containing S/N-oxide reductase-like protein
MCCHGTVNTLPLILRGATTKWLTFNLPGTLLIAAKGVSAMPEQVYVNLGHSGGPFFVHVKDGKITRVRPLVFSDNEEVPTWTIKADGREYSAPRRVTLAPFHHTERARAYCDDRILSPLKRTSFNLKGDRNPERRGKDGFQKISWDEALDIVVSEMKRVRDKYGPEAVAFMGSSHHTSGNIGMHRSCLNRFFRLIGATDYFDNPDSWEGWMWGACHTYGFYWRMGPPEQADLLADAMQNSELIVFWSNDPDTNRGNYAGQETAIWRVWLKEMGKKMIFIDPFCNYTAAIMADKWIAPRPGTDAAMAEAIAYVWLKEGTYDKDYVATHTVGFEQFKKQILGEIDNLPRTPGWAEEICGVSARTITALAREWASKKTVLSAGMRGGMGGACREAYGHEWARLMVLLQAMQGLGKPGVSIWGTTMGAPINYTFRFPGFEQGGMQLVGDAIAVNPVKQRVYRTLFPDSILNPPVNWLGEGFCTKALEQQFIPYTYPSPGKSEIKFFYRYGGSFISVLPAGSKWIQAYQSPKLDLVVNQDCWWCTETKYSDIIFPACTNLERNDIAEFSNCGWMSPDTMSSCNHRIIVYQQKCIEPLGDSRTDYWIFCQLAERMGIKKEYTEGRSEEEWIRKMFDWSDLPKSIAFEEFQQKGYYLVPLPESYKPAPSLRWFYEGRECDTPDYGNPKRGTAQGKELATYSGKIEFVSQSLSRHFPDDQERPPLPRYIPSWEGHASALARKYPLQLITPHPRFSIHTQYDHTPWIWDIPHHRILKDSYYWLTVRIHQADARARGIQNGEIIKLYNDRAAVLGIAYITERVRPGVVHAYEASAKYDPVEPGKPGSADRGGCVNLLTTDRMMSKNAPGFAPNSCLIEIAKHE